MPEVNAGAIEPIGVFTKQLAFMVELTETFKNGNIRGIDYLRAMAVARENLDALLTILSMSMMSDAGEDDRITPETLAEHRLEQELLTENLTQEEKLERVHKALHRIAKPFRINVDEEPPEV